MSAGKSKRWLVVAGGLLLSGAAVAGVRQVYEAPGDNSLTIAVDANKLSPEDTVARSHQMQTQMSTTEGRVAALQKRAENKKDMVMVNCVSDKLVQVRGYVAVGAQAGAAIDIAAQRHDDAARAHNFDRQNIVFQKVLVLGTEAEGCAGEDVSYTGSTIVDVEVDPSIPETDPTIPPAGITPTAGRPPEATPFA